MDGPEPCSRVARARFFTAICPPEWTHGARPGDVAEAPLPYNEERRVMVETQGVRERTAACAKPKGKPSFNCPART